jgi:phosphatidylinositol glycan class M
LTIFGKLVFTVADVMVGMLIYQLLLHQLPSTASYPLSRYKYWICNAAEFWSATWLLNPLAINMSTRGSADALVTALVIGTRNPFASNLVIPVYELAYM